MYDALVFRAPAAQRFDVAIAAAGLSRREARRRIEAGLAVVNSRPVAVASRMLKAGDRVVIFAGRPPIDVISKSDEWLAVNKPAGVSSQPGESAESPASIFEAAAANLRASGEKPDLYLVHRLDRATSGALLLARTERSAAQLSNAFARAAVKKTYIAVVDGIMPDGESTIDAPIDRVEGKRFGVAESGRPAKTIVETLFVGDRLSVVEVHPLTGRTHQIRVHLSHAGDPVAGDLLYRGSRAARLLLHAWKLEVREIGSVIAPLPEDFANAIDDDRIREFVRSLTLK